MVAKKTTDQFVSEAQKIQKEKYDYSKTKYLSSHLKVKIICNIHGEFNQTPHNHLKGQGCPSCGKRKEKLRLKEEVVDKRLVSKNIKRISEYQTSNSKMTWQCLKCSYQWKTTFNSIDAGHGCPSCNHVRLSDSEIDQYLNINKPQISRVGSYIDSYSKIEWKCLKCFNIWKAKAQEIMRKNRVGGCPHCCRKANEKLVGDFLIFNKIKNEKIKLKINGKNIFPDFFLSDYNLIIEYNGIQHYQPTAFGNISEKEKINNFKKQVKRDEYLRIYCSDNAVNLLEINGMDYKGVKLRKFLEGYFKTEAKK